METPVLTRRRLLSLAAATPAALVAARTLEPRPTLAQTSTTSTTSTTPASATYPHTLPPLPYAFDALEPHIDAQTMQIHHDRHHQTYVTNLNNALKDKPALQAMSAEDLIRNLDKLPDDVKNAVRNNAGGHV